MRLEVVGKLMCSMHHEKNLRHAIHKIFLILLGTLAFQIRDQGAPFILCIDVSPILLSSIKIFFSISSFFLIFYEHSFSNIYACKCLFHSFFFFLAKHVCLFHSCCKNWMKKHKYNYQPKKLVGN